MGEVYQVSFYHTNRTQLIEGTYWHEFLHEINHDPSVNEIKKVKRCQSCGNQTEDFQVVDCLARCEPCAKESEKVQKRANNYIHDLNDELYYSYDSDE
jgi:hypothetical protein